MPEKRPSWLHRNIKGSTLTYIITGISILVLVGFIVFNLNMQRKLLEEALLSKGISMAWTGAAMTSHILEGALDQQFLTEAEVFDREYIEISGTDPPKYHTSYDGYLDANLQGIEDEYLQDSDVTFALAVDINGYAPAHNSIYSAPLTGDFQTDLEYSRSKRIFADEVGILAARNTDSYLWQIYHRDTGEVLWDISSPIMVKGRHWGAYRVGFSLADIDEKVNRAEARVLLPAVWLVCGFVLVAYWVGKLQSRVENVNHELAQEIEQRRSVQAALAKENELLNISLNSMAEAVITVDCDGLITSFNPGAEILTGYSGDEALGRQLEDVLAVEGCEGKTRLSDFIDFLQNSGYEENPPTLVCKDGSRILVESGIYPLKGVSDSVTGYVLIGKNVTQRHQDEIEAVLSQKMESIGRLASGIAHEINTPIQYVGDNIHYLNRVFHRYDEVLDECLKYFHEHCGIELTEEDLLCLQQKIEQKKIDRYRHEFPKAVQEAQEGIDRVRKIVQALREFTHPSMKEKKYADINQGIMTTITISSNEWKYHADMETDLAPDLPQVYCQIDEINQVVLNIIINASQAIKQAVSEKPGEKGRIMISTKSDGEYITIIIRDTGVGIPENIIHRVFDPFFTTKEVNEGAGQGLALAHNIIVKNHNGKISVDSQIGKGSIFCIDLPVKNKDFK